MADAQVHKESSLDVWIGGLLLLQAFAYFSKPLSGLVQRLLENRPQPVAHGPVEPFVVFGMVVAVVVFILASRRLRARLGIDRALTVVWSAAMALLGGLVIHVATFAIFMSLAFLLDAVGAGAISHAAAVLGLFLGVPLAAYWSGWRFGKWGYFWGIATFLLLFAVFTLPAAASAGPPAVEDAIVATFMLLLSAACGKAGAGRFQARLRKEEPGPVQQPPAEPHPS